MEIKDIPLDQINDPKFQPRDKLEVAGIEALANSIRELGLINPILVQKVDTGYRLIAGTRRYHAFQMLGRETITAKIMEGEDREFTLLQFSENFHRQDLNPIQTAKMIQFLLEEMKLTTIEIAQLTNKSRDWVSRNLSLLEMPQYLIEAVETGVINPSIAYELKRIPDEDIRQIYVNYALQGGCTEKIARQWVNQAIATIAARDQRIATREIRSTEPPPPPSPAPQPTRCYICGAPEDKVILETIPLCWHCQQAITKKPHEL